MDLPALAQRIILTLRTVRFVRTSQLFYGIWFKLRWVSPPDATLAPGPRGITAWTPCIPKAASVNAEGQYTFLSTTLDFSAGVEWSHSSASRLWLYNLHYFDFINTADAQERSAMSLAVMRSWVSENQPVQGTGWEPYPASLRIVNWIKWLITLGLPAEDLLDSLAVQIRWLSKTVEYHILANHLFTNGKALVYAGIFFKGTEADRWLAQGLGIVNAELAEQVLEDGGHFERSPMYHHIILEDLLDLLNLAQATPGTVSQSAVSGWQAKAGKMLAWARTMGHPGGELAFFNDSAYRIASTLLNLEQYAQRLDLPLNEPASTEEQSCLLAPSGFALLNTTSSRLIADIGPIGPDYQPGHAHADSLSFEMAYKGDTLIVNSGTSTYETGEQRQYERSTAAHSTVEVNGQDSSEVWAGFRVARRAQPFDIQFDTAGDSSTLVASHDGYRRLSSPVTHTRQWVLDDEKLVVTDWLTGKVSEAVARFYLHPDVQTLPGQHLVTKTGHRLKWEVEGGVATLERSLWYPAFGQSVENNRISVRLSEGPLKFTLCL